MIIRFIDMFCGIGGFRLGLEGVERQAKKGIKGGIPRYNSSPTSQDGNRGAQCPIFRCVWSNDNDKYACQVYRKHWGNGELYEGDIRTVDIDAIPEHDLLCAGFPCQDFSIAGRRAGIEGARGTLFFEICRVLRAKRPSYVFLENVRGLQSSDDGRAFGIILTSLDELGYDCQWQVLNSKDYGVPQNRERVFIIGHLREKPRPKVFPIGEGGEVSNGSNEEESREKVAGAVRGGQSGIPGSGEMYIIQTGHRTKGKPRFYDNEIPAMTQDYGTGGQNVPLVYDIYNQGLRANQDLAGALKGEGIADTSLGTALIMRDGRDNRSCLRGGRTLELGIKGRSIRRLTPLECERLQGFPDNWTEGISDTQRYKCLGNAVTVNVIEAIGRQMAMELKV